MSDRPSWIVDEEDIPLVSQYTWYVNIYGKQLYAVTSTGLLMHRLIMDAKMCQIIDHINGNGLDNRRENLRICTHSQNHQNQHNVSGASQYKGVCLSKSGKKWRAYIYDNGKRIHLGYFFTERAAARAYDNKAKKLFGEFAKLNLGEK